LLEDWPLPLPSFLSEQVETDIYKVTAALDALRKKTEDSKNLNVEVPGIAKLKAQIDGATQSATNLYKETQKLFSEKPADPLDGLDSTAAKTARAYDEVSKALQAASEAPNTDAAAQQVERAAAAINSLKASGEVAGVTIDDLRNTLKSVFDDTDAGQVSVVPIFDVDQGAIVGYTDEVTQKMQAQFNAKMLGIKPSLDLAAFSADVQTMESIFSAAADRMRAQSQSILAAAGIDNTSAEVAKRGSE